MSNEVGMLCSDCKKTFWDNILQIENKYMYHEPIVHYEVTAALQTREGLCMWKEVTCVGAMNYPTV